MAKTLLDTMSIGSVFLFDPSLKPKAAKPSEDEYTDCKILFYYPKQ